MYEIPEDIRFLYHSTNDDSARKIEKEGLKTDYLGMVYLSEKPIKGYARTFKVMIPNKGDLVDWRDVWYGDEGEEIDMEHNYDPDNPYYIHLGPIPAKYLLAL